MLDLKFVKSRRNVKQINLQQMVKIFKFKNASTYEI